MLSRFLTLSFVCCRLCRFSNCKFTRFHRQSIITRPFLCFQKWENLQFVIKERSKRIKCKRRSTLVGKKCLLLHKETISGYGNHILNKTNEPFHGNSNKHCGPHRGLHHWLACTEKPSTSSHHQKRDAHKTSRRDKRRGAKTAGCCKGGGRTPTGKRQGRGTAEHEQRQSRSSTTTRHRKERSKRTACQNQGRGAAAAGGHKEGSKRTACQNQGRGTAAA